MKRLSLIMIAVLVMVSMSMPVSASSSKAIKLNRTSVTIEAGDTVKLKVSGVSKVTFKSSSKAVATVTSKGTVTGIKSGTCRIYATYKKGKKTKKLSCKVNVYVKPYLSSKRITIKTGQSKNVSIKGKYISSVKYSTNSDIIRVSNGGRITGINPGVAYVNIHVSFTKTGSERKSSIDLKLKVTVVDETDLSSFEGFTSSYTSFAASLFKNEYIARGKANILVSPQSVANAMMMAAEGASGNTLTQLKSGIAGTISLETFRGGLSGFNRNLSLSQKVKFSNANSVWIKDNRDEFVINEDYVSLLKKHYDAESFQEPFNNETSDKINSWVSDNTDNQIKEIIENIPADAVMYLINALCFEGEWAEQYMDFNVIKEKNGFTNINGTKEDAIMLSGKTSYIIQDSKSKGFLKYYKGGDFAFAAILPNEGVSLSEYINGMTGESFLNMVNHPIAKKANTKVPQFKYDYATELSDSLKSMGITDAFNPDLADFTKIGTTDTNSLSISRVVHKTHIELDRYGTKASAATAVEMSKSTSLPENVTLNIFLDRPFIYAIIDTDTGLPVFIGTVTTIQ